MIINDYVLTELNQQRRTQVAEQIAALRETKDQHRRWKTAWRRRARTASAARPVTSAVAYGTGSAAR